MTVTSGDAVAPIRERYPDCAVKGCGMAANGFSRYCAKHRRQFYLTRSPTGRILRKGRDLNRYRDMAAEALAKHREHPAFQAAFRWLESLMDEAERFEGGGGVKRDLATEFRRLRRDGATGEAMFLRIAAVWGYAEGNRGTWPDDVVQTVNLGHHALRTTPKPGKHSRRTGKVQPANSKGTVSLAFGKMIRETLGVLLMQLWEYIEREFNRQARTRSVINDALQEEPLA